MASPTPPLWANAPSSNGPERDAWILEQIKAGNYQFKIAPVTIEDGQNSLTFQAFTDALKVGGVRVNASAKLMQQIADFLGCILPTAKMADLIWASRAQKLQPMPRTITSSTSAMIDQSAKLDKALGLGLEDAPDQIAQTVGKFWVLTNKLVTTDKSGRTVPAMVDGEPAAANYGWHFQGSTFDGQSWEPTVSLPGVRLIQGIGTRHNYSHSDYSQNVVLVGRSATLNGQEVDLAQIVMDPAYSKLVSAEGPLKINRQPGVDEVPYGGNGDGDQPTGGVTPSPPVDGTDSSDSSSSGGGVLKAFVGLLLLGGALVGGAKLAASSKILDPVPA